MNTELSASVWKKLLTWVQTIPLTTWFSVLLIISSMIVLQGFVSEGYLSIQSLLLAIAMGIGIYMWIRSEYSKKLARCQKSNSPTVLDDLCNQTDLQTKGPEENKRICKDYAENKKNFYNISNLLLQQYIV